VVYEAEDLKVGRQPFLATELLDAQTRKHLIGSRPLEIAKVLQLGIEMADAVDAAHTKGIVLVCGIHALLNNK
jgi:hypothetical protein